MKQHEREIDLRRYAAVFLFIVVGGMVIGGLCSHAFLSAFWSAVLVGLLSATWSLTVALITKGWWLR